MASSSRVTLDAAAQVDGIGLAVRPAPVAGQTAIGSPPPLGTTSSLGESPVSNPLPLSHPPSPPTPPSPPPEDQIPIHPAFALEAGELLAWLQEAVAHLPADYQPHPQSPSLRELFRQEAAQYARREARFQALRLLEAQLELFSADEPMSTMDPSSDSDSEDTAYETEDSQVDTEPGSGAED
jgi:hypothetical protein